MFWECGESLKTQKLWHSRATEGLKSLISPELFPEFLAWYESHVQECATQLRVMSDPSLSDSEIRTEAEECVGVAGSAVLWALTEAQETLPQHQRWRPNDIDMFFTPPDPDEVQDWHYRGKWFSDYYDDCDEPELFAQYWTRGDLWNLWEKLEAKGSPSPSPSSSLLFPEGLPLVEERLKCRQQMRDKQRASLGTNNFFLQVSKWELRSREQQDQKSKTNKNEEAPDVKLHRNLVQDRVCVRGWVATFDLEFCQIIWTPRKLTINFTQAVRKRKSKNVVFTMLPPVLLEIERRLDGNLPTHKEFDHYLLLPRDIHRMIKLHQDRNEKYRKRGFECTQDPIPAATPFFGMPEDSSIRRSSRDGSVIVC